MDYDIFMSIKRNLKLKKKKKKSYGKGNTDISWWIWKRQKNETADNISQMCCPHVELFPDILTL